MQGLGKTGPGQGLRSEVRRLRFPAAVRSPRVPCGPSRPCLRGAAAGHPAARPGGAASFTSCLAEEMVQNKGPEQTQELPPLRVTIMLRSEY